METTSEKANSEVTKVVENLEDSTVEGVEISSEEWPTLKEIVDLEGPFVRKWNIIFIVSCVLSVLLDPLFLYIPIVDEDMKCLRMDKNLKIAALVLRSLTDLCYILSIVFQVYRYNNCTDLGSESCSSISFLRNMLVNIAKIMSHSYIIIDILAVLPLPQVKSILSGVNYILVSLSQYKHCNVFCR